MDKELLKVVSILNKAPCGIGLIRTSDGNAIFLNDAFYSIVGYSREDYTSDRETGGHVIAEDREAFLEQMKAAYDAGAVRGYEYRIRTGGGTVKWVRIDISRIIMDDEDAVFISITDISKEHDLSARMESVAENIDASISIVRFSSKGERLIFANDFFFKILEIPRETYMNDQAYYNSIVITPSQRRILEEKVKKIIDEGKNTGELEYSITAVKGTKYWIDRKFSLMKQPGGEMLMFSISWDVTERVLALRREAYRQERYRLLVEQTGAAVFEWNLVEGTFECTPTFYKYEMSKVDPDDILNNRGRMDVMHPDDMACALQFFEDTKNRDAKAEAVLRLKMTDGNFRWSRMLGIFVRDADGKLTRVIGTITDIDEEKQKSLMMESLLNALPGGIAIIRLSDFPRILYFNEGFRQLSDWTREAIEAECGRGVFLQQFVLDEDYPVLLAELRAASSSGRSVNITFRYRFLSGAVSWIHLTATRIREENGWPVYYAIFTRPTEETLLYRMIVDDSVSAILVAEKVSRNILFVNSAWCGIEKAPENKKIVGKNLFSVVQDPSLPLTAKELSTLSDSSYSEFHRVTKEKKYLNIHAKSLIWNGVSSYILYITDETAERQQREQLQNLINRVPGGVGIYEVINGVVFLRYINDGYFYMMDAKREDRIGYMQENALLPILPEDRIIAYKNLNNVQNGSSYMDITLRLINGFGKYIWIRITGTVVQRNDERLTIYCSFSNVDNIMKLQNDLQYNRTLLNAAIKAAAVGVWEIDGDKLSVVRTENGAFEANAKRTIKNIPRSLIKRGFVHKISAEAAAVLLGKAARGEYSEAELLIRETPNAEYRWKRTICTPVYDTQGKLIKTIGTTIDINVQKERQKKYEEQLNLRKALARNSLGMMSINLTKNTIEEKQFEPKRLMNYSGSADRFIELFRSCIPDGQSSEELDAVFSTKAMLEAYQKEIYHASVRHKIKGYSGWLESSWDIITNPYNGDIEAFWLTRDVTDDKRAELVINTLVYMDYDIIYTFDANTEKIVPFMHNDLSNVIELSKENEETADDPMQLKEFCADADKNGAVERNSLHFVKARLEEYPVYITVFSIRKDGMIRHKRAMYCFLEGDNATILCAVQDYTESYRQEERQKNALEDALLEAKRADAAKTDFLSNMSHEIRTPMNTIIGLTKLAEDELPGESDSVLSYLRQIGHSSDYLLGIINDILDMSRIERDKFDLRYEWVRPRELFCSCIDMMTPQMKAKDITFSFPSMEMLPQDTEIYTDVLRTKQMLMNLLNNAYKFTARGGFVTFDIKHEQTGPDACVDRIRVSDTGCGMSKEFMKRIFLPFAQERNDLTGYVQGTGLGLALSKKIAAALGGDITVETELGKGSAFTIEYPFKFRVCKEEETKKQLSEFTGAELKGCRVLLAEDHPLNAAIAVKLLSKIGVVTDMVSNGKEAFDRFSRSEPGYYDGVLMDIRMPEMGGLEAAKAIRALDRDDADSIPIIAMTANAFEEDIQRTKEAGMNAHLSKPIEPERLYETLSQFIGEYKKRFHKRLP